MVVDKSDLYRERKERLKEAMELGKPDKVPIRLSVAEFAAKYAGYSLQEIYYEQEKNLAAMGALMADFDIDAFMGPPSMWWASIHDAAGAKYLKFSGRDLEKDTQFQFIEEDYMKAEDYEKFIDNPTAWIMNEYLPRLNKDLAEPGSFRANIAIIKAASALSSQQDMFARAWDQWKYEYGAVPHHVGFSKAPFDTLGDTLRGLHGIMMDMWRCPDQLKAAMDVLVDHNIYYGLVTSAGDTELPLFMPLHRGSYPFLNPKQWDEFYWPTLKRVIEGLWEKGKRTLFFAEGNWTPYLEKIAELPEKSIVFHVDQTDMSLAKKILGGKFCLSGNVSNTLLAFGDPAEVKESVKKIINEYAADGGFILDSAAVIQADAKPENINALVEACREYGVY